MLRGTERPKYLLTFSQLRKGITVLEPSSLASEHGASVSLLHLPPLCDSLSFICHQLLLVFLCAPRMDCPPVAFISPVLSFILICLLWEVGAPRTLPQAAHMPCG